MSVVERIFAPRLHDIGGLTVGRVLPFAQRCMVGPFIFLDHMGPAEMAAGQALDVRPHPHIGLSTLTYLFEGEIFHRDNLGNALAIAPGAVNWMTAGRGIAHSERTPAELRNRGGTLFGIQLWVGLPRAQEETAPSFVHHGAESLPLIEGEGKRVRVIAGDLLGARSPVVTLSPLFYADAALDPGARLSLAPEHEERAGFLVDGTLEVDGMSLPRGRLFVLRPGRTVDLASPTGARVLLLGGTPLDGRRHLWWNFVSSSKERIEEAKADWKAGRFDRVIGETEFIPLPE